jgi:hypothetical protein
MSFCYDFRLLEFKISRFHTEEDVTHPQIPSFNISEIQIKFIKIIGLRVKSTTVRLVFRQPLQNEQNDS